MVISVVFVLQLSLLSWKTKPNTTVKSLVDGTHGPISPVFKEVLINLREKSCISDFKDSAAISRLIRSTSSYIMAYLFFYLPFTLSSILCCNSVSSKHRIKSKGNFK